MIKQLKSIRKNMGLTQTEIAEISGLTQAAISRLEITENCTIATLLKYANAVGHTVVIEVNE